MQDVYKRQIESRRMNFVGIPEPYGVYEEKSERVIYSYFKRSFLSMLSADTVFVSLFAMEKRMFAHDAMVLHCSDVYKRQDQPAPRSLPVLPQMLNL